ncbi:uncharacterized protein KRP23_3662 [Phytophthora ramorum]|uniref:uncharacterized protein n=1 Tax=Phytophthora ramorum TaxID=164328 RepID=UPI0030960F59|nr:hypothetical protein KRP23_3662 [Phytophthora ramorum]
MLRVWRRVLHTPLGQRGNLFVSSFSSDSNAEGEEAVSPPKYDHVRKLIVGLGNPATSSPTPGTTLVSWLGSTSSNVRVSSDGKTLAATA